jgi:poly-gamma-glutamate synthesis protein (capsule biosynthesis protein)
MLAGDVMTGRGIDQVLAHPGDPTLHEPYVRDAREYLRLAERAHGAIPRGVDPAYVWGDALAHLRRVGAPLAIVNLETAITGRGEPWPGKGIHYRMHPSNVSCLTAAGIGACVLANNHVMDWGTQGLEDTLAALQAGGLRTAGAGAGGDLAWAPTSFELGNGRRVLLFACATASSGVPGGWAAGPRRAGVALLPDLSDDTAQQLADDALRQRRGGGLAVLSIHWGGNWGTGIPPEHRRFARRLIDLGAYDLVHGHSSHHPLALEVYRGRLILYGCGDLINDYEGIVTPGSLRSDLGCLYFATLAVPSGRLEHLEMVPLRRRRFRLENADRAARDAVIQLLDEGSEPQGTCVVRGAAGTLELVWKRNPAADCASLAGTPRRRRAPGAAPQA